MSECLWAHGRRLFGRFSPFESPEPNTPSSFDLRAGLRLLWSEGPVDRIFLLRLQVSCLIGVFYFFRLMFPETGVYEQAVLDPERAAGIVYARALWVPFWFLVLLGTWRQRRGERIVFWAFAIVTTLNLFFDIPYFFLSSPHGFSAQALFPLRPAPCGDVGLVHGSQLALCASGAAVLCLPHRASGYPALAAA